MHTAATDKVPKAERIKLGKLHIRMRNCKTLKVVESQSIDYAIIHGAKKGILPYPPAACTPPKRYRGPPRDVAASRDIEFPYICR
jgi:hypothetical protein